MNFLLIFLSLSLSFRECYSINEFELFKQCKAHAEAGDFEKFREQFLKLSTNSTKKQDPQGLSLFHSGKYFLNLELFHKILDFQSCYWW
jgi:hypothetical protein